MLIRISHFTTVAAVISTLALVVLTHLPSRMLPLMQKMPMDDKQMHLTAFFVVTLLYGISVFAPGKRGLLRLFVLAVVMSLFAAIDEYTQQFFGRSTCLYDYYADLRGIGLAMVVSLVYWFVRMLLPINVVIRISKSK